MSKLENARSHQETVRAGLHILARIIAREVVKDRLGKMDGLKTDPSFTDTMPAQVGEYLKGAVQQ
jgi:hypothetical protein